MYVKHAINPVSDVFPENAYIEPWKEVLDAYLFEATSTLFILCRKA